MCCKFYALLGSFKFTEMFASVCVVCVYVLRAKRGFAQSRDCPAQTLDPWLDWPRNPGIARAQSMDQDNPGIALRKA